MSSLIRPPPVVPTSPPHPPLDVADVVPKKGCVWVVPGAGTFTHKQDWTFTGKTLPKGLVASDFAIEDVHQYSGAKFNHTYLPENVQVADGFLNLVVPGGQTPDRNGKLFLKSAEVRTTAKNILYASVRVSAILSSVPGTCQGHFFYSRDDQESDMEYISDPKSLANSESRFPNPPLSLFLTNHDLKPGFPEDNTQTTIRSTANATTALNWYRMDWVEGRTQFYLNGNLMSTFTTNVPFEAGIWVWNNWANGHPGWSSGPPATKSVFRIKEIIMYHNATGDNGSC